MTARVRVALSALAAAAAMITSQPAHAQFYKGKTLTMIINYPAGGPSDIEGRIMTQFLPSHIAGNPRVIVKNVSGGGGMIGVNFLGEIARPDGESFGFFTWNPMAELLGDPGLRVKFSTFSVIAGVENPFVAYARKDTPPGITSAADLTKVGEIKSLSLDVGSVNTINMTLSLDLLGLKYKAVYGYKGLKEVETAILQKEGNMANTSLPGWSASVEPTMGKQGIVVPLWQLAAPAPDGTYPRSKRIASIPTFEEAFQQVKGSSPSGIGYEALRAAVDTQSAMFRGMFIHPGVPKEAVEALRAGFVSLWKDKKFIETYAKVVKSEPELVDGPQAERVMAGLGRIRPEVKKFIDDHIKKLSTK